ncbi:hypothetical protein SAMN04488490_1845 [Marinobacter sp. LV10R510-11A]|uniref:dATP/dGTP diphosphohydrolase domain-containing protein n=1 Tax=Marinobacter sp. LV10R510-11A TaxID=1415568 RepID=UPI000BBFC17D|nr:dATP/dGTP diphosphohydrolase domain-containing protein [Marinobacter sp. LV10R510-11A]SOB76167.1 hypothetical protein SAMN04488490_1845 [Marinobacter sp. LV10R510-11A]
MSFDEDRIDAIGQNGNDGEHYKGARFNCGHNRQMAPGQLLEDECMVPNCLGQYVGVDPSLDSPGVKYDTDKPMMDLIPPVMELEIAHVLTFGAAKYGPDNWRHVPDLRRRYIAAAKRHINALQQGIERNEETGLHHAAHAACCLMFLGEVDLVKPVEA